MYVLDLRNLQQKIKKAFCFKNCTNLLLLEWIVLVISKKNLTVGHNNFGNKIPLKHIRANIFEKIGDFFTRTILIGQPYAISK